MPVKKFLEEYPLYKKFITDFRSFHDLNDLPKPAIHMTCGFCNSDQTFNMSNEYYEVDYNSNTRIPNIVVRFKNLVNFLLGILKWIKILKKYLVITLNITDVV